MAVQIAVSSAAFCDDLDEKHQLAIECQGDFECARHHQLLSKSRRT
jgi:hypothetical protein